MKTPPKRTATVANVGLLSFLKNAANICVNKKHGITNFMGIKYSKANGIKLSLAPKNVRSCLSKKIMTIQNMTAKRREPMTAVEKYSF